MARPTRQGVTTIFLACIAFVVGRVFGITELYIIGAAMILLVIGAWLWLTFRPDRLEIERKIYPRMVEASSSGNVRVDIRNGGRTSSPVVALHDPIGSLDSADIELGRLRSSGSIAAVYEVPTYQRGIVTIGPMTATRTDPLRLARRSRATTASDELKVTPKTFPLAAPNHASGPLGTHLRSVAQRLGTGDFHSLRDYAPGDEPRSVHWRASAKSDQLKVKQNEHQHLERCTIILDIGKGSYRPATSPPAEATSDKSTTHHDPDRAANRNSSDFERAISCAASIVAASHLADLNTQFLAGPTIDHRGPDVLSATLTSLASLDWDSDVEGGTEKARTSVEPSDGLSLIVVVSATPESGAALLPRRRDPAATEIFVSVAGGGSAWNMLGALSLPEFQSQWDAMVGHTNVGPRLAEVVSS